MLKTTCSEDRSRYSSARSRNCTDWQHIYMADDTTSPSGPCQKLKKKISAFIEFDHGNCKFWGHISNSIVFGGARKFPVSIQPSVMAVFTLEGEQMTDHLFGQTSRLRRTSRLVWKRDGRDFGRKSRLFLSVDNVRLLRRSNHRTEFDHFYVLVWKLPNLFDSQSWPFY